MEKCLGEIKTVATSEGSFCESGRMNKFDCISFHHVYISVN